MDGQFHCKRERQARNFVTLFVKTCVIQFYYFCAISNGENQIDGSPTLFRDGKTVSTFNTRNQTPATYFFTDDVLPCTAHMHTRGITVHGFVHEGWASNARETERDEYERREKGGAYASHSWGWIYGECFMVPPVGKHLRVNSSIRWENSSLIFAILREPVSPFVTLPECTSLLPRCIPNFIGVSEKAVRVPGSCENFVSDNYLSSDYAIDYELSLSCISNKEERERTSTAKFLEVVELYDARARRTNLRPSTFGRATNLIQLTGN